MHAVHAVLQSILLLVAVFVTFDAHAQPRHHSYLIGLYLNVTLLLASLLADLSLATSIGKRLILWLLYYELIAPLIFYFVYLIGTHSGMAHVVRFFFFYLCAPLLYFSHLTLQSIAEFLQDTPSPHMRDEVEF
jgi:hypothetical protein